MVNSGKNRSFTEVMTVKKAMIWLPVIVLLFSFQKAAAQGRSAADTILLGAVIDPNGDTIAVVYLPEFELIDKLPKRFARQQAYNDQLRYNVYKVYPYAVIAAGILKDVDVNLAQLPNKKARKAYLKTVEKQLNDRFKGELENLSIQQGQILVRLIDRQTGKNCFSIIQELKGGFSAVIWQSVALLFSNNLRREYDPNDRDKDIETIVRELEASNYYRYQSQHQVPKVSRKS